MIEVVVGLVYDANQQLLLAKRAPEKHQGGLWEFPGGKVEADESQYQALCRELKEEIAIDVVEANYCFSTIHDYPKFTVQLHIWQVTDFNGEACGAEGQAICWAPIERIESYDMPDANKEILLVLEQDR